MYEAPRVEPVYVDAGEIMSGILNSGGQEWTENERSIDSLYDDLMQN